LSFIIVNPKRREQIKGRCKVASLKF